MSIPSCLGKIHRRLAMRCRDCSYVRECCCVQETIQDSVAEVKQERDALLEDKAFLTGITERLIKELHDEINPEFDVPPTETCIEYGKWKLAQEDKAAQAGEEK